MIVRLGSTARTQFAQAWQPLSRFRPTLAASSRTNPLRSCGSAAKSRVSRPHQLVKKTFRFEPNQSLALSQKLLLLSKFPTKTALLVVVLGLIVYLVEIEDEEERWVQDVHASFSEDEGTARPLCFLEDKEEVDHYISHHITSLSEQIKSPEMVAFALEVFKHWAGAWWLTGDEALKHNIPVTHGVRIKSNDECEDYFALGTNPGPGERPWNYWAIMDGHAGKETSKHLQTVLIPRLSSALLGLPATSSEEEVDSTIKRTFLRIDQQIMDTARTAAAWFPAVNASAMFALAPAIAGSCALLAAFNPDDNLLRVACVGDSRAVLGRWNGQKYECIPLSTDQTGFNPSEVSRLEAAHPDEPDMLSASSGRLLGLAVTRAFGDHRWKWDNDFVKTVQHKFWGHAPRPQSKTPPYLTAEPDITTTKIHRAPASHTPHPDKADFMIMASDGLWDRISSHDAVECISRYLDARHRGQGLVSRDPHLLARQAAPAAHQPAQLEPGITLDVEAGEQVDWRATPDFFAIEDDNAATCLARNAMGGTRRNLLVGLMGMPRKRSREAYDDTTIMVVFFDMVAETEEAKAKGRWWRFW